MAMLSWIGTTTLETYLAQFNTRLSISAVPDGQSKALLHLLPDEGPLINMALCSMIYIGASRSSFKSLPGSSRLEKASHDASWRSRLHRVCASFKYATSG